NIKNLEQHQGGEGHRLGIMHIPPTLNESAGKRAIEDDEGSRGHNRADKKYASPHAACDHPFTPRAGWTFHETFICWVNSQSERRGSVGHQVDPENLGGEKRKHNSI